MHYCVVLQADAWEQGLNKRYIEADSKITAKEE